MATPNEVRLVLRALFEDAARLGREGNANSSERRIRVEMAMTELLDLVNLVTPPEVLGTLYGYPVVIREGSEEMNLLLGGWSCLVDEEE